MAETDDKVQVLKEIRDELRAVRTELAAQLRARTGVRTERRDRVSRWRLAVTAATGAVAGTALVLALRAGGPAPAPVAPAPPPAVATTTPDAIPAPAVLARPAVVSAPAVSPARPSAPKPALAGGAAPVTPAARSKPAPVPPPSAAGDDGDETMAFSPPRRRVRAHKMSYGPVESEPAKL